VLGWAGIMGGIGVGGAWGGFGGYFVWLDFGGDAGGRFVTMTSGGLGIGSGG
jgi:hypothetical protein